MTNQGWQPKTPHDLEWGPPVPTPRSLRGGYPTKSDPKSLSRRVEGDDSATILDEAQVLRANALRYYTRGVWSVPEDNLRGLAEAMVGAIMDEVPKSTRTTPTQRVMDAIAERDADIRPYCDILVRVQDGKPVHLEITTKHKPTV